jgi:hypothetical protein
MSRSRICRPCSPITTPASTIPMMCGMRNLPITIGASKMMSSTTKKMGVGLVIGKYVFNINISGTKLQKVKQKAKLLVVFFVPLSLENNYVEGI